MNKPPFSHLKPRALFARFFVASALVPTLVLGGFSARAQGQTQEFEPAPPITNASGLELQAVGNTLDALKNAALARDAAALSFYGASVPADGAPLFLSERVTHVATSASGALVRENYTLSIERQPPVILSSGAQELWLARAADGSFAISKRFVVPPDALAEMQKVAAQKWSENAADAAVGGDGDNADGAVLDLVASRVGGRWISLRSQLWNGHLSGEEPDQNAGIASARDFIRARMKTAPQNRAITAHFLLERGQKNWFGVGAAFNEARRLPAAADSAATLLRARLTGTNYASPETHRDFGLALGRVYLWNEAADELQKAELLQPGTVETRLLNEAEANRAIDPENIVKRQKKDEEAIGFGRDHPQYLIQALVREQANVPSVLGALRLALEYSRLAEADRAAAWGKQAQMLMQQGRVAPRDAEWVQLLSDHLRERQSLEGSKPSNILRSKLFTVRVWPDDVRAVALLGGLEEAQHTVYANFGIPMGNTEVILWHDQGEFARYTTKFTEQGGGEFVTALTLTKLVATQSGPIVLGEEINTFSDSRDAGAPGGDPLFGTVAHEYGHVAVRQLSRGRLVPVWFNEGIATSVEGGYEGYIGRVQRAVNGGTQLSMREMLGWQVDGERAFLAYSQANSIVDFMVQKWGKNAVLEVLRQIGRDTPPDAAFRGVLGVSQNQLWQQWLDNGIA